MNTLKHLLTLVAFGYLCYHIYTFGPGMFNVTVLVILVLSTAANYFREKRESDLKANENARKARAEARHAKKHKKQQRIAQLSYSLVKLSGIRLYKIL